MLYLTRGTKVEVKENNVIFFMFVRFSVFHQFVHFIVSSNYLLCFYVMENKVPVFLFMSYDFLIFLLLWEFLCSNVMDGEQNTVPFSCRTIFLFFFLNGHKLRISFVCLHLCTYPILSTVKWF